MSEWKTVSLKDLSKEEPVRLGGGHSFGFIKNVQWLCFCKRCGHIKLKNDVSQLVTKIGCGYESDVRYKHWRARK